MPELSSKSYASNLSDAQWARIAPVFERNAEHPARKFQVREVVNAILYVMRTGCQWRALPREFPGWNAVYKQQKRWAALGFIHLAMQLLQPRRHGVNYAPTVAIIDSSSVEGA